MSRLLILILFFAAFGQLSALYCVTDSDCNLGDCCIEYLPFVTRCADKGDDVGDRCGGQFHCDCADGLFCKPHPKSIWNFLKLGKGRCQSAKGDSRYHEPVLLDKVEKIE